MPVEIVVDSAASLPLEMSNADGFHVVPMRLAFEGRSYLDGVDLSPTDFYKMLMQTDGLPTTSAPSPAMFGQAIEEAGRDGSDVLCLTVAAHFSASYESAQSAAKEYQSRRDETQVWVLDTQSAAGGQGLIVLEAWRAAQKQRSLSEVLEAARNTAARVHLLAAIDTLFYLWKSGRVPRIAHAATSLTGMKPIFELAGGEVRTRARPRSMRRALSHMINLVEQDAAGRGIHMAVMHACAQQEAEELRERAEQTLTCLETFITEFTPAMGAHTGPGLLGLAYWVEEP